MYINPEDYEKRISWGNDEDSFVCYSVASKEAGHEGRICFVIDKDGNGLVEWRKDQPPQGYGVRVSLKELVEWMESRNSDSE